MGIKLTQDKADETTGSNISNNTGSLVGEVNNTNNTPAGQVSIPLEKPPFID